MIIELIIYLSSFQTLNKIFFVNSKSIISSFLFHNKLDTK